MPECDVEDSRYDYVDSVLTVSEKQFLTENGIVDILNSPDFTNGTFYSSANENTQPGMKALFQENNRSNEEKPAEPEDLDITLRIQKRHNFVWANSCIEQGYSH